MADARPPAFRQLLLCAAARRQRGVLSVEAAYALPVIIAAAMMFMELANFGLTINMGASALERAVQELRQQGVATLEADVSAMQRQLRERMADASHHYLSVDNIATVDIEHYATLDAMGGGNAAEPDEDGQTGVGGDTDVPAWRISVDIRKDFITPLPRLLGIDSDSFRYRYQQVLSYLPQQTEDTP
jgi:hypothetical protein